MVHFEEKPSKNYEMKTLDAFLETRQETLDKFLSPVNPKICGNQRVCYKGDLVERKKNNYSYFHLHSYHFHLFSHTHTLLPLPSFTSICVYFHNFTSCFTHSHNSILTALSSPVIVYICVYVRVSVTSGLTGRLSS